MRKEEEVKKDDNYVERKRFRWDGEAESEMDEIYEVWTQASQRRSTVGNDELGDLRVGEFQAELGLGTLRFEVGR